MQTLRCLACQRDLQLVSGKLLVIMCLLATVVVLSGCTPIEERRMRRRVRTVDVEAQQPARDTHPVPSVERSVRRPTPAMQARSRAKARPALASVRRGSGWTAVLSPASAGAAQPTRASSSSSDRINELRQQVASSRSEGETRVEPPVLIEDDLTEDDEPVDSHEEADGHDHDHEDEDPHGEHELGDADEDDDEFDDLDDGDGDELEDDVDPDQDDEEFEDLDDEESDEELESDEEDLDDEEFEDLDDEESDEEDLGGDEEEDLDDEGSDEEDLGGGDEEDLNDEELEDLDDEESDEEDLGGGDEEDLNDEELGDLDDEESSEEDLDDEGGEDDADGAQKDGRKEDASARGATRKDKSAASGPSVRARVLGVLRRAVGLGAKTKPVEAASKSGETPAADSPESQKSSGASSEGGSTDASDVGLEESDDETFENIEDDEDSSTEGTATPAATTSDSGKKEPVTTKTEGEGSAIGAKTASGGHGKDKAKASSKILEDLRRLDKQNREKAKRLLAVAQEALAGKDYPGAKALANEAFELDPGTAEVVEVILKKCRAETESEE